MSPSSKTVAKAGSASGEPSVGADAPDGVTT